MERGGLMIMLCGAGTIIAIILNIMCESRVWGLALTIGATIGFAGFLVGIAVWGSGWILKEDTDV